MNPIRRIRRIAGALAFACLVLAVAAPAAFARTNPPFVDSPGVTAPSPSPMPVRVQTVIVSGMPGCTGIWTERSSVRPRPSTSFLSISLPART